VIDITRKFVNDTIVTLPVYHVLAIYWGRNSNAKTVSIFRSRRYPNTL
jgi:hypothetical protein